MGDSRARCQRLK